MKLCSVDGCERVKKAKGYCALHYRRHRTGYPMTAPLNPNLVRHYDAAERFWDKIDKTETCWLWTGAVRKDGYGVFSELGGTMLAHRYSYEFLVGPIPDGLQVDHLCRVRHCVRPEHLEPVTQRENLIRGIGPEVTRARHQAKTACAQGHDYTSENTYVTPVGQRVCRTCMRVYQARYRGKAS